MMKSLWNSFAMFSKIPMPQADWSEENMRYMLCFFPFVGAAVGVVMLGMEWLCCYFGMSNGFIAVALVLVPVIVTGGIHVDGLLDTSDALSSWRDREKRLEILKDSHAGAFAVITACVYFLTMYGGMSQIVEQDNRKMLYILATGYMVSRCLSGIGVITLPKANASGTVAEFSQEHGGVFSAEAGFMFWIQPVWGTAVIVTALLVFWFYRHKALKYFGGTTGDLSGYFLCLCEVWIVLVLAIITVVYKI